MTTPIEGEYVPLPAPQRGDDMKARSKTFPEIAQAMAEQWGGDIRKAEAA